jgi:hypothetical protein
MNGVDMALSRGFSLDFVVTDLNKRGAKEGTSAPPNRWGILAVEEEDVDVS